MKHSRLLTRYGAIALTTLALSLPTIATRADEAAIELYTGYGSRASFLVEGRVVEQRAASSRTKEDNWLKNLWRTLRRFSNEELDNFPLRITLSGQTWPVTTDSEGYFRLEVANAELPAGWHAVSAIASNETAAAQGEALIVSDTNSIGVISDMDDTLLVSDVNHKATLMANTFLKNSLQRVAVPGAAQFIRDVVARNSNPDSAAVIYLSASPRQLYGNITEFLVHNDFPRGVLIAKRVSEDKTSDPLFDQFAYKTAKIADIFKRLPNTAFVLMGDDGEKDPEIYHDIVLRFPNRVSAVYIRKVNPDSSRPRYPEQLDYVGAAGSEK